MSGTQQGARTTQDFVSRADLDAAVKRAVEQTTEQLLGAIEKKRGAAPDMEDDGWARKLALAIAEISDQGNTRKRVDPVIQEARERSRDKMLTLIAEYREMGELPSYNLKNLCFFDEIKVEPYFRDSDKVMKLTEIGWPGIPNYAMVPLNDAAKAIHAAFVGWVGSTASLGNEDRKLSVTAGGLTILAGPTPGGALRTVGGAFEPERTGEGLRIKGRNQPGQVTEKRVLGTVAAPARQTA